MLEQYPNAEPVRQGARSHFSELSDECLITSKQLKKLNGNCSDMHIWRLLNDEKYQALAFPKPIKINDRNYWRLGAVRQWNSRPRSSIAKGLAGRRWRQACACWRGSLCRPRAPPPGRPRRAACRPP